MKEKEILHSFLAGKSQRTAFESYWEDKKLLAFSEKDKEILLQMGFFGKLHTVVLIIEPFIKQKIFKERLKLTRLKETDHFSLRRFERKVDEMLVKMLKLYLRNLSYPFRRRTVVVFGKEFLSKQFGYSAQEDLYFVLENRKLITVFWRPSCRLLSYVKYWAEEENFIIIK